jgi:protein-ribulosamine 3-kinase
VTVERILATLRPTIGEADAGSLRTVGGGSINRSYEFATHDGPRYFLKLNHASLLDMFEAERDGLAELAHAHAKSSAVRVPAPLASGVVDESAYLLLERLDLATSTDAAAALLGERLAAQHRITREHFGWHRDNTIGGTPQINTPCDSWVEFWRDTRLGYQLELAKTNGIAAQVITDGQRLLERLPEFFVDYTPVASLLHGDLWGGNWGALASGEPVIFDPAVYFGDREADIAMTQLFGGFSAGFMRAYEAAWPLDTGYPQRIALYNLYHILNHYNLFGGGYQAQAADMLERLLAPSTIKSDN